MNLCCHTVLFARWLQGRIPQERFTCDKCGQSYHWQVDPPRWLPIRTADDIEDMNAHQAEILDGVNRDA